MSERQGEQSRELTWEECVSMTFVGDAISAQVRGEELALHVRDDAPRSSEAGHPVLLGPRDVARLRALLDESKRRDVVPNYHLGSE